MPSRFRHADAQRVLRMPVDSAQVILKGAMCFLNVDDVRSVTAFTYVAADLPASQANFAAKFLGIAQNPSASGETREIGIARAGVYEFDCAAATFEVGDLSWP